MGPNRREPYLLRQPRRCGPGHLHRRDARLLLVLPGRAPEWGADAARDRQCHRSQGRTPGNLSRAGRISRRGTGRCAMTETLEQAQSAEVLAYQAKELQWFLQHEGVQRAFSATVDRITKEWE